MDRSITALAAGLMAGALPLSAAWPHSFEGQHVEREGWTLTVAHNRFTGQTRCSLKSSDGTIVHQPGAVGFKVHVRDTLEAWYKVDNGNAVRWQDVYPALIANGAKIDGPSLDNPTGRMVWLPFEKVASAKAVTIRASERRQPRIYLMRGYAQMLDRAHQLGCTSDATFAS